MVSNVGERLRRQVAERAYHVCEYCLIHEDDTFWGCEIDHIISRKHGGISESDNLAWACGCCNNTKGSDLGTLVGEPPKLTPIFHPRRERWRDRLLLNGVRIDGADLCGEATVKLLALNHENRVRERDALAQTGRCPTVEALARSRE
jgi:hypothetical protein